MSYKIALIPGDGVGKEVTEECVKIIEAVSDMDDISIEFERYPNGAEHYLKTGETLSEDTLEELKKKDAILFGAVGDPRVEKGILEKGILLKIRMYFDQFVNLRPITSFPGLPCPLAGKTYGDIQFYFVRENTEDFYVGLGYRGKVSRERARKEFELIREIYEMKFDVGIELDRTDEVAYQIGVISRKGAERVIEYAFSLAKRKNLDKVTSIDKANVLTDIYGLWRDVFDEIAIRYSEYGIKSEHQFVDAAAMSFVKEPERYRVVVSPNLFGDILTDLGAAIQGGIGNAASGNINPEGISMFEPIHGSAPDIAGKGIANPIGSILSGAMMLDELGEEESAEKIRRAVKNLLMEGKTLTRDIGGRSRTEEVGDRIVEIMRSST